MDFRNTFLHHFVVALISLFLVLIFWFFGIYFSRAVAAVAFILLFLTLIIGPLMRLWGSSLKVLPWNLPWGWRGELGVWFFVVSIIHASLVHYDEQWDVVGYITTQLSGLVAAVALFLTFILVVSSFGKVIKFLGILSWKWLHSFSYVIFYLVSAHVFNHAFLRQGRPKDWLDWLYLVMIIIVVVLQFGAFGKTVLYYHKGRK